MNRRRWTDEHTPRWQPTCWLLFGVACVALCAVTLAYTPGWT